jgi:glyoxylase-like metal-dependent hydrolase (beta-lactamase superfamily II)
MQVWVCAACGVEYPESEHPPQQCAICEDERQYVPRGGQAWTSIRQLSDSGTHLEVGELEPHLFGITATPRVGIGQQGMLVQTDAGNLLWDPPGFVDEVSAAAVHELGGVAAIATSHPHMFGAQVEWSRQFGDAPVYVSDADKSWVQRPHANVRIWSGQLPVLPSVRLAVVGGHFPGSAVAIWSEGAEGRGVMLSGDSIFPGPDGRSVSFMRSFPNRLPMSAAVVERIARQVSEYRFDRLYGNLGGWVDSDAQAIIRSSTARYAGWVRGDFDHLT